MSCGKRKYEIKRYLTALKKIKNNYEPVIKKLLCILMDCEISN